MPVGPGTVLQSRYRVIALLDSGGMGQVWRGEDETLKRGVAIKVMQDEYADQESFHRFIREAQVAAGLDHPGITSVYDFGRHENQYFIVMQLLRGQDLKTMLKEHPRGLPLPQAASYAIQAAEALAVAHEAGVIHRDLKPANLFIVAGDRLKICDFGIAKHLDATRTITRQGEVMGTPAYMSPEQWEGGRIDARSDIYSLGCVLYELLAGRPPFGPELSVPALWARHAQVMPQPPQNGAYLPAPLSDLVLRMLAKAPADRPGNATALAEQLKEIDLEPPAREPLYRPPVRDSRDTQSVAPFTPAQPYGGPGVSADAGAGRPFSPAASVVAPAPGNRSADPGPSGAVEYVPAFSDRQAGQPAEGAGEPARDIAQEARRTARARLRGWTVTAAVTAWLLALGTIALAVGAPFGVEQLVWLWVLVPVAVIDSFTALVSTVSAFERGGKVAWTLALLLASVVSMVALVTHVLAPPVGVPISIVAPIAAFWFFVDSQNED